VLPGLGGDEHIARPGVAMKAATENDAGEMIRRCRSITTAPGKPQITKEISEIVRGARR